MPTVDKVTLIILLVRATAGVVGARTCHEDVASFRYHPTLAQEFDKIPELAVYVSADGDRRRHRLNVRLLDEDCTDPFAENFHVRF